MGVVTNRGGSPATSVIGFRNGENLFRNPSFNVNQGNLSGTVTLAAYTYGHDGLIAGGNGATYTFAKAANGLDTVITITAGQLILPVAPELIDGSTLCFTYTGTAGFRVATNQTVTQGGATSSGTAWNAPALATATGGYNFTPSPNTQVNIMFGDTKNANNSVTFSVPQLERVIANVTPTRFQRRDPALELAICQRYGPPTFCDVSAAYSGQANCPTVPNGAFTTVAFTSVNNDQGGNFNTSNNYYTCPITGLYQLTGNIRVLEGTTNGTQVGIGIYTSNNDGQFFHWNIFSYPSGGPAGGRVTVEYVRTGIHNKGDQLRLYTYTDTGYQIEGCGMQVAYIGASPRGLLT